MYQDFSISSSMRWSWTSACNINSGDSGRKALEEYWSSCSWICSWLNWCVIGIGDISNNFNWGNVTSIPRNNIQLYTCWCNLLWLYNSTIGATAKVIGCDYSIVGGIIRGTSAWTRNYIICICIHSNRYGYSWTRYERKSSIWGSFNYWRNNTTQICLACNQICRTCIEGSASWNYCASWN